MKPGVTVTPGTTANPGRRLLQNSVKNAEVLSTEFTVDGQKPIPLGGSRKLLAGIEAVPITAQPFFTFDLIRRILQSVTVAPSITVAPSTTKTGG